MKLKKNRFRCLFIEILWLVKIIILWGLNLSKYFRLNSFSTYINVWDNSIDNRKYEGQKKNTCPHVT